MAKHWSETLKKLGACGPELEWAATQPSPEAAWETCDRPDRLIWYVFRISGGFGSPEHRKACLCLVECVRPAMKYVPAGEKRPTAALDLVERYGNGEAVTREELRAAAEASRAAAASHATARAATFAASRAAFAAGIAANAIVHAVHAVTDAVTDAAAARAAMCKTIRKHYPTPPEREHAK